MEIPAGIYLLKDKDENTRTIYETCSKLTIKTPECLTAPILTPPKSFFKSKSFCFYSNVIPFVVTKSHTYLNKPAAFRCWFV